MDAAALPDVAPPRVLRSGCAFPAQQRSGLGGTAGVLGVAAWLTDWSG